MTDEYIRFASDGATIPGSIRCLIENNYPPSIMKSIDQCGAWHDIEVKYLPILKMARDNMIFRMRLISIPKELIFLIKVGLTIYDMLPKGLRSFIRNITSSRELIYYDLNITTDALYRKQKHLWTLKK